MDKGAKKQLGKMAVYGGFAQAKAASDYGLKFP